MPYQLEQSGSTIFQTLAGLVLDRYKTHSAPEIPSKDFAPQRLLNCFLVINVFHLFGVIGIAYLQRQRNRGNSAGNGLRRSLSFSDNFENDANSSHRRSTIRGSLLQDDSTDAQRPLLMPAAHAHYSSTSGTSHTHDETARMKRERKRGQLFAGLCGVLIVFAWVLFMGTAWFKLGMKKK